MRSSDRSAFSENALRWIAGLLLAALLTVAWFQHRWLEQLHSAQVERQVAALTSSLEALQKAFDHRFFSWALAHEMTLAELAYRPEQQAEPLDDLDATVIARYYRRQRDPADDRWLRLESDGSSTALEEPPEIALQLPPALSSLTPVRVGPERLVVLLAEVLPIESFNDRVHSAADAEGSKGPLVAAPLMTGTLASAGPVMLVVLDRQRFMTRVFEPIVERTLPLQSTALDYAVVERRADVEEIVYGSTADLTPFDLAPADGETPLLRPDAMMQEATRLKDGAQHSTRGICFDCGSPVGLGFLAGHVLDRRWHLRVRAREGSLNRLIDQLRVRNLWISVSGVALLGSAILLLVVLTARAQRLAHTQMEFVSSVSHELRTPLAVMASAASNLAGGLVEGPRQVRQYGDVLSQETRRLRELIERVLTFAKLDEGGLEVSPVDVASVIERVVSGLNDAISEQGLTLEVRVADDLPPVQANATALESALRNLLDNAIRHGAGGGCLRIEAEVDAVGPGGELRISVQDWGEGIEAAESKRLFDPFFRGRHARDRQIPGTGLGLSLVSKIAAALGGRIHVRSALQTGAIFDLFVPLASSPEGSS